MQKGAYNIENYSFHNNWKHMVCDFETNICHFIFDKKYFYEVNGNTEEYFITVENGFQLECHFNNSTCVS